MDGDGLDQTLPLEISLLPHAHGLSTSSPLPPALSPGTSPPSPTVHEVFSHTLQLLRGQHLLEAHAEIMMMEHLRDDILSQLHLRGLSSAQATVLSYFSGLQELNESLAKQLWGIVASSLQLVREDPVLFVTAVRIIEREEKIDDTLLLDATFLPPGRPKGWRQKFYHVLQETITGTRFHTPCVDAEGPGLSRHLEALQRDIVSELRVVKDLMVQCVPAHYNILSLCAATYHQALASHLQDILREDLDKQALFHLLKWVLHVYHRSAAMPRSWGGAGSRAVTSTQSLGRAEVGAAGKGRSCQPRPASALQLRDDGAPGPAPRSGCFVSGPLDFPRARGSDREEIRGETQGE